MLYTAPTLSYYLRNILTPVWWSPCTFFGTQQTWTNSKWHWGGKKKCKAPFTTSYASSTECRLALGPTASYTVGGRGKLNEVWSWPLNCGHCSGYKWYGYTSPPHISVTSCLIKHRETLNYIKPWGVVNHYHTCTESLQFLFSQTVTAVMMCKVHHSLWGVFLLRTTLHSKTITQSLHTILIHTPNSMLGPGRMKSLSIGVKFC
jgi:hypothetical protein